MGAEAQAQLPAGVERPHYSSVPGALSAQAPVPQPVRTTAQRGRGGPEGFRPRDPRPNPKQDGFQSLYLDYLLSYLEPSMSPSACPAHFLPSSYTYELSARLGASHAGDQRERVWHTDHMVLNTVRQVPQRDSRGLRGPNRMASLGAGGLSPP